MTLKTGKAIFDERVEYPLPEKHGVRDYIVYLVPASDGYGSGARYFFEKFFKRHVHKTAVSLEDVVNVLQADAAAAGVSQIRELVIVAHGTADRLIVPLVRGTSESLQPEAEGRRRASERGLVGDGPRMQGRRLRRCAIRPVLLLRGTG